MKVTFTKFAIMKQVIGFLEEGQPDEAQYLIEKGIVICFENDSEIIEIEDPDFIKYMNDTAEVMFDYRTN